MRAAGHIHREPGGQRAGKDRTLGGGIRAGLGAATAGAGLALVVRDALTSGVDKRAIAAVSVAMAAALLVALALVSFLSWRVALDRRSLHVSIACFCYATFPLALGVLLPSVMARADLAHAGAAFQIAGAPAVAVFGLAARAPGRRAVGSARTLLGALLLVTAAAAALCLLVPASGRVAAELGAAASPPARLFLAATALAWIAGAVAHAVGPRRRAERSSWTWPVTAGGLGLAWAIGAAAPGGWTYGAAGSAMVGVLLAGLWGAVTDLQRDHTEQQRELRDAVVRAAVATSRARAVDLGRAELRHDAGAALLGIEAAVQGLGRHRDLLTPAEWEDLSRGLVAEVHRLGALLGERADEITTFDLLDVVGPVTACARAGGLDVTVDVPPGIRVEGSRDRTAHVVQTLLDNARKHAPGSPVHVSAGGGPGGVTLRVRDRGPGVPGFLRASLFERGVRGAASTGSGLGLFVARRLLVEAGGALWFEAPEGGGSAFVLALRPAAPVLAPRPAGERRPGRPPSEAPARRLTAVS